MHGLTYDEIHDEFTVPQQFAQAILTFQGGANGETAPLRVIQGSKTRLEAPDRVAVDAVNNEIYVPEGDKILVYDRMANGNVKPKMTIRGPRAMGGPFAIYPPKKLILATNRPGGEVLAGDDSYLGAWSYEKSSDGAPLWTIGGPHGVLQMPRGVTLDVKNKSIIASDKRLNSVLTFHLPEMF